MSNIIKSILESLPNGVVSDLLSAILLIAVGYVINEVKDRWQERREFRSGIPCALDCVLAAEEKAPGPKRGAERFIIATDLYVERTRERKREVAEQIVALAFTVSAHYHEPE